MLQALVTVVRLAQVGLLNNSAFYVHIEIHKRSGFSHAGAFMYFIVGTVGINVLYLLEYARSA